MPSDIQNIKIGELLVLVGAVSSGDITEAIQVSKRLNVPIGRVLTMSGCIAEEVLEASLQAQPLIRDGHVPLDAGIEALKRVFHHGRTLEQALQDVDCMPQFQKKDRLAQLLLDSDIVTQGQLDQALVTSFESGIPLGSALVLQGVLSPALFPSLLRIQKEIREGTLSRTEGVEQIKSTFMIWLKAEESLKRDPLDPFGDSSLLMPDLDTLQAVASESNSASDKKDKKKKDRGEQKAHDKTHESKAHDAKLHDAKGHDAKGQAKASKESKETDESRSESLHDSRSESLHDSQRESRSESQHNDVSSQTQMHAAESVESASASVSSEEESDSESDSEEDQRITGDYPVVILEEDQVEKVRMIDLFKNAGIFTQSEVQVAYEKLLENPVASGKLFMSLGLIDEETLKTAIRCHSLLERGHLNKEEAIFALKSSRTKDFEKELDSQRTQAKRYLDPRWRGKMKRVLGGCILGAVVAGLTFTRKH